MADNDQTLDEVAALLRPVLQADPRIAGAYLFGSRATGETSLASDTDVAILVHPDKIQEFSLRDELGLEAELALRFRTDKVDLVVLNRCPLPLAYNVLAKGHLIYEAAVVAHLDFVEETLLRYFDFAPRLAEYYREYDRSFQQEYSGGRS